MNINNTEIILENDEFKLVKKNKETKKKITNNEYIEVKRKKIEEYQKNKIIKNSNDLPTILFKNSFKILYMFVFSFSAFWIITFLNDIYLSVGIWFFFSVINLVINAIIIIKAIGKLDKSFYSKDLSIYIYQPIQVFLLYTFCFLFVNIIEYHNNEAINKIKDTTEYLVNINNFIQENNDIELIEESNKLKEYIQNLDLNTMKIKDVNFIVNSKDNLKSKVSNLKYKIAKEEKINNIKENLNLIK